MNIIDAKEINWKPDSVEEVKKEAEQLMQTPVVNNQKTAVTQTETPSAEPTTLMGKLKTVVRKAVDCCIE